VDGLKRGTNTAKTRAKAPGLSTVLITLKKKWGTGPNPGALCPTCRENPGD